jgi:hypothetical protein
VLALAIIAIPSAALALFVAKFGINVIINDEWDMVPIYKKMIDGNLNLTDLFAQHNEHRIFFPRLAMLAIERLTAFNTVAEMYLSWILVSVSTSIIFFMFWTASGRRKDLTVLAMFLPISLLMLSFRQEEAILWGFTCQIYFALFGTIAAFYLLDKSVSNGRLLPLSILGGIVASYSFLVGLAVWPAGLIQIALCMTDRTRRIKMLIAWIVSSLVVTGLYFHHFHVTSEAAISRSPMRLIEYVFAVVGAPFTFELAYLAASIGIVVVLVAFLVFYQAWSARIIRANSVWVSCIVFAAISALTFALGRSGIGPTQALSSRYTPITVLGIVGLYSLAVSVSKHYNGIGKKLGVHALLTLILLGLIVSGGAGWHIGQQTKAERLTAIQVLKNYQTEPDTAIAQYLNPTPALVREWSGYLAANKLSVFASANETDPYSISVSTVFARVESVAVHTLHILTQLISAETRPLPYPFPILQ